MSTSKTKHLLENTKVLLNHYAHVQDLTGESFNVFSVLKMETNENATHSAFISELLNIKGTHRKGHVFLELFIRMLRDEVISNESEQFLQWFDVRSAVMTVEHSIGDVNLIEAKGGRIDILIMDKNGYSISIENKIYATDQEKQLKRYWNYNRGKNMVLYLTLNGVSPSDDSKSDLVEGEHFWCMSYRDNIINWLELCQKEAFDVPILRETLKQYAILLKKLTNQTINKDMEDRLLELMDNYYVESRAIYNLYEKFVSTKIYRFYNELANELANEICQRMPVEWEVNHEGKIGKFNRVKIRHKKWHEKVSVCLEDQGKTTTSFTAFGIKAHKDKVNRYDLNSKCANINLLSDVVKSSAHWPFYTNLFDLSKKDDFSRLIGENRSHFVIEVSKKMVDLAEACKEPLAQAQVVG